MHEDDQPVLSHVCIMAGNSDDKLSQLEWCRLTELIGGQLEYFAWEIHFRGFTASNSRYQTAAWMIDIEPTQIPPLQKWLADVAFTYKQDSIAWLQGNVGFIAAAEMSPE